MLYPNAASSQKMEYAELAEDFLLKILCQSYRSLCVNYAETGFNLLTSEGMFNIAMKTFLRLDLFLNETRFIL